MDDGSVCVAPNTDEGPAVAEDTQSDAGPLWPIDQRTISGRICHWEHAYVLSEDRERSIRIHLVSHRDTTGRWYLYRGQ